MSRRIVPRAGRVPGDVVGAGAVRRWLAPASQVLAIVTVLGLGLSTVVDARADLRAERGAGPVLAAATVVRAVSPPVTLGIPDLDITTRLIGVRKGSAGALGVPADPGRAGWYSQGPAPGDPGPAVIVGHVDSVAGPGIFARLRTLTPGAPIRIRRADGTLVVFVVTQVQSYAKRDFPTDVVYRGDGRTSLRLITCGGDFDRRSRSYRSNVVVYAAPA